MSEPTTPVAPPVPPIIPAPIEQARSTTGKFIPKPPAESPSNVDPEISLILNMVETDLITDLKSKYDLEQFTDFSQPQRIKLMRALKAAKVVEPIIEKDVVVPDNNQKGLPTDPTTPPVVAPNPYVSNLKRNNLREWQEDMNKKNTIHNITDQIRGKVK